MIGCRGSDHYHVRVGRPAHAVAVRRYCLRHHDPSPGHEKKPMNVNLQEDSRNCINNDDKLNECTQMAVMPILSRFAFNI